MGVTQRERPVAETVAELREMFLRSEMRLRPGDAGAVTAAKLIHDTRLALAALATMAAEERP